MTKRGDPEFLEVLVRQIRQDAKANIVLGKALGVLPETNLVKPVRNLLHALHRRCVTELLDRPDGEI